MMLAGIQPWTSSLARAVGTAHLARLDDPERNASFRRGWDLFTGMLEIHHRAEDELIWPRLRRRLSHSADALSVLDAMDAEHARIDPLIARIEAALTIFPDPVAGLTPSDGAEPVTGSRAAEPGDLTEVGDAVEELRDLLVNHMAHEERDAMPLVDRALTDREWRAVVRDIHGLVTSMDSLTVADFVPWLTDGHPAERERVISTVVPAPVRPVYRLLWKRRYQRTPRW